MIGNLTSNNSFISAPLFDPGKSAASFSIAAVSKLHFVSLLTPSKGVISPIIDSPMS